jgi:hypothetical protein
MANKLTANRLATVRLPLDEAALSSRTALIYSSCHEVDRFTYKEQKVDDDVVAAMRKRIAPIVGRRNLIKSEKSKRGEKAAEIVAKIMAGIPYEKITEDLADGIHYGFSVQAILGWNQVDGLWIPELKTINQDAVDFVPWEPDRRDIPDCGLGLDPATEIATYLGYEVRLLTKEHPFAGERVPADRLIVFSYGSSEGNPLGKGLAYHFRPLLEIKRAALNSSLRLAERLGSPPVMGKHPASLNSRQERELLGRWRSFLKAIGVNGWIDVPEGFSVDLLEMSNNADGALQEKLVKFASDGIFKVALTEVPYSATPTGAYAANESQVSDRERNITDADCDHVSGALMTLWRLVQRYNFPQLPLPIIKRWTTDEEAAIVAHKTTLDAQSAEADLWGKMLNMGFVPTSEKVRDTFGDGWELPGVTDAKTTPKKAAVLPDNDAGTIELQETRKKILKWNGLTIDIQYPIGTERHGKILACSYGCIQHHKSPGDGKALDCLVGLNLKSSNLYKINQVGDDPEPKIAIGFGTKEDAIAAYLYHYPEEMFGGCEQVYSIDEYSVRPDAT